MVDGERCITFSDHLNSFSFLQDGHLFLPGGLGLRSERTCQTEEGYVEYSVSVPAGGNVELEEADAAAFCFSSVQSKV